jgi:hypothetical protein
VPGGGANCDASIRAGQRADARVWHGFTTPERAIAGHDYEKAVIPDDRLTLLSRYDARAAHYEVVSTNEPP